MVGIRSVRKRAGRSGLGGVAGFTHLLTHPTLSLNPLSVQEVREMVKQWLESPSVRLLTFSKQALPRYFDLLAEASGAGNLSTDALIASHAMKHSSIVYSNDGDFDRFPGVKRINPLV